VRSGDQGLAVRDLRVARGGRTVVTDVSLDVRPGQITALLGPNGAGKSSLVLALAGVIRPSAGTIHLGSVELTSRRPERIRAAGLAIVPEGRRLLRSLTVRDNLRVSTFALTRDQAGHGLDYALELFPELGKRWDTPAGSLSGGEQQMVVLAQALAARPAILVVDELSLGLAPVVVQRLMPSLTAVAEGGVGVLLIEQFAHVALELAANAYILGGGQVRYHGSASELSERSDLLEAAYRLSERPEYALSEHHPTSGATT
jgi:branched-chain amino acid transport system ATP-binding protein